MDWGAIGNAMGSGDSARVTIGPGWSGDSAQVQPVAADANEGANSPAPSGGNARAPWWARYLMGGCALWAGVSVASVAGAIALAPYAPSPRRQAPKAPPAQAEPPRCDRRVHVTQGMCRPCYRAALAGGAVDASAVR